MRQINNKYVIYTLVFLVLGFMISYSYQLAREMNRNKDSASEQKWTQEYKYRKLILEQEQTNSDLQKVLNEKQKSVLNIEKKIAKEKNEAAILLKLVDSYRAFLGEVPIKGTGVEVSLTDASYIPDSQNVNDYMVHEQHIFKVVNELFISGANAVSINGQRLTKNTYIKCEGPIISVDGTGYPAPFVIQAIGNSDTLQKSLLLKDGVIDQIKSDNVDVKVTSLKVVEMQPNIDVEKKS